MPKRPKMLAIDLFSGCGGLTQGLVRAGFKVLAGVEISKAAQKTYSRNHPKVRLFGNIKELTADLILESLKLKAGDIDLLAGCPPCQGFSTLRTLNRATPASDPRNELIFDFIRLVEGLLPKTIMLENVPGLRSDDRLVQAKARLDALGYRCIDGVVNAADFGVPQRRKRMILIASRCGEVEIPNGDTTQHKTVRNAIGDIPKPKKSRKRLHRMTSHHGPAVLNRIQRVPKDGGSRSAWGAEEQLKCHKNPKAGFRDIYGRMAWDKVSPTITRFCHNPSKGRFLHPTQDRAISLYEAALLQSFPRSYKFPADLCRQEIASMIGEALPPLLAEKQAIYIAEHLILNDFKINLPSSK